MNWRLSIVILLLSFGLYALFQIPADLTFDAPLVLRTRVSPEKVFELFTDVRKFTSFHKSPPNITEYARFRKADGRDCVERFHYTQYLPFFDGYLPVFVEGDCEREWLCKYEDMPDGSQHIFHRVVLVSRPHSPVFGEITITPVSVDGGNFETQINDTLVATNMPWVLSPILRDFMRKEHQHHLQAALRSLE